MDLTSLEGISKVIGTNLDISYGRSESFYLNVTLKERFPEEYIRSLSDIKGKVIYRNIPDPHHHH